jgi:hypothetical protein
MERKTDQRITVYVGGEPRRFFLGLKVRHAIGYRQAWRVERGRAVVQDDRGNLVDLDSLLQDGAWLYVIQHADGEDADSLPT